MIYYVCHFFLFVAIDVDGVMPTHNIIQVYVGIVTREAARVQRTLYARLTIRAARKSQWPSDNNDDDVLFQINKLIAPRRRRFTGFPGTTVFNIVFASGCYLMA